MSGSQYLQLVRNSMRAFGTGKNLASFIKSEFPNDAGFEAAARDIRLLSSKGEFNLNRVVAGRGTANALDAIAQSPLLVSASAGGIGLKPPPFDPRRTDDDSRARAKNYKSQLSLITDRLEPFYTGGTINKTEQLASAVIKKATGTNFGGLIQREVSKIGRMERSVEAYLDAKLTPGSADLKEFFAAQQSVEGMGDPDQEVVATQKSELTGKTLGKTVAEAINRLKQTGVYMNTGGGVSGNDSVPAMLTPGEFVMSPEAVQKHGVGFMRNLNRGKVKGFRRGGLVGGVAYRANGSSGAEGGGSAALTIDSSQLQETLAGFSANFQSSVDNVVAQFSLVSTAMNGLATAIGQGMTLNHVFSGDMTLAFNIQNGDHLKNMIADAITPKISEIIANELDQRLNKDFEAG